MVVIAAPDAVVQTPPVPFSDGELARLVGENAVLRAGIEELRGENERLKVRVAELVGKVEELRRGAKRQAAPFSRGKPKTEPRRPGRRLGDEYGKKAQRRVPEEIDETLEAPLADRCECGGEIEFERIAYQYQEELPEPRPIRRRIEVHVGRCRCCGRRHQGRHRCQTSDALGAAGSQLGPRAVATATQLNKELGLSPQKTAKALLQLGGISVTPGGVVQAVARQARALQPTYGALIEGVRRSEAVSPDETGWRVQAGKAWLWVFVGDGVTVYLIADGRGYEQACLVLGADYAGIIERDGWAPYRRFEHARHQSCLAHLLRRCGELIADSRAGQARIPHAVRRLLLAALALRDRHTAALAAGRAGDAGGEEIEGHAVEIDPADGHAIGPLKRPAPPALPAPRGNQAGPAGADGEVIKSLQAGRAALAAELDALLERSPTHQPNRKLLKHLANEREHLLTFLEVPGVHATNWRAEQAIRPAVVNRKSWGGNRTWAGAHTQQVTMSVIRTARQQQTDPIELMAEAQRQRTPTVSTRLKLPTARSDPALAAQTDG